MGKLLTRLTSDVDALAEVFGSGAVVLLADLVTLLVIAATMITLFVLWRREFASQSRAILVAQTDGMGHTQT